MTTVWFISVRISYSYMHASELDCTDILSDILTFAFRQTFSEYLHIARSFSRTDISRCDEGEVVWFCNIPMLYVLSFWGRKVLESQVRTTFLYSSLIFNVFSPLISLGFQDSQKVCLHLQHLLRFQSDSCERVYDVSPF